MKNIHHQARNVLGALFLMCMSFAYGQDVSLDIEVKFADGDLNRPFVVGDRIVFEIYATNNTATPIDVFEIISTIPSNFVVNSSDLTPPPAQLNGTFVDLEPGIMQIKSSFNYTIVNSGEFLIEVDDSGGLYHAEELVVVLDQADLSIKKSVETNYSGGFIDTDAFSGINENLTYKLTVENLGGDDATNIIVKDIFPGSLEFVSASPAIESLDSDNNELTWVISSLNAGDVLEISVVFKAIELGVATNQSSVATVDQVDFVTENNADELEVDIRPLYDLTLNKSLIDPAPPVQEGDIVSFQLNLTNDNRVAVPGPIIVEDILPSGYEILFGGGSSPGISYDPNTRTIQWEITDGLGIGESASVSFLVQINIQDGSLIYINTASIVSDQTFDTNLANDESSAGGTPAVNTDVNDLSIEFILEPTSYGDNRANVGEEITVFVKVANLGDQVLGGDQLATIIVPDGLDLFFYDLSNGSFNSGILELDIPVLNPGEEELFELKFTILDVVDAILLQGYLSELDDVLLNNFAELEIIPIPVTDIQISHTLVNTVDRGGEFYIGDLVEIKIEVLNNGPSSTTEEVDVLLTLHDNLEYESSVIEGLFDEPSNSVSWIIQGMSVAQMQEYSVFARILGPGPINVTSQVEVLDTDPLEANNIQIDTDNIAKSLIDIEVVQDTTYSSRLVVGSVVDYTLTITNNGPSDATNIEVANYLPTGLEVIESSISNSGALTGSTITWGLASLGIESVELTFQAQIVGADLNYENRAELTAVSEDDIDSSPNNMMDHLDDLEDDESIVVLNFIPLAIDDDYELIQAGSMEMMVLDNDDYGLDGPAIDNSLSIESLPSHGDLTLVVVSGVHYFEYSGALDYYGEDQFVYRITDSNGDFDLATVFISIIEDIDGDGIAGDDDLDSDNDGVLNSVEQGKDSDGDGIDDALDVDSDNDGILDVFEAQINFQGHSGTYDEFGVDLVFNGGITDLIDTDSDGIYDLLDLDSDQDSVADFIENADRNSDGFADFDSGTSWNIIYPDVNPFVIQDTEGMILNFDAILDLEPNFRDVDDDGDRVLTIDEDTNGDGNLSNDDCDDDGYPNYLDADSCQVDIIKGIAPDGIQEEYQSFKIEGLTNLYPNFEITIVNRWGSEVFHYKHNGDKNTEPIWWNGRDKKGQKVQEETYYYVLEYNKGNKKPKKDWIFVKW